MNLGKNRNIEERRLRMKRAKEEEEEDGRTRR